MAFTSIQQQSTPSAAGLSAAGPAVSNSLVCLASMESTFIRITQDGIGRLSYVDTPKNFIGLCTDSLDVCHASIFIGSTGIVLIHDTGRISKENILHELGWVGDLQFCVFAFCGHHADTMENFETFKKLMQDNAKDYKHKVRKMKIKEGNGMFVRRQSEGNPLLIESWLSGTKPGSTLSPNFEQLRHRINIINNILQDVVSGDLQFDGRERINPQLILADLAEVKQKIIEKLSIKQVRVENVAAAVRQVDDYEILLKIFTEDAT